MVVFAIGDWFACGWAKQKVSRVESLFAAQGGREALEQSCKEHLRHERQNWRPFARAVFVPLRSALLRLAGILPLQGTTTATGLLNLIRAATSEGSPHSDYLTIDAVAHNTLPREWRDLVHDHADHKHAFNRRQLEVVLILELATAIKAGEIFVSGSLSFDRFWDRLPTDAADPAAIAAYSTARGWGDGADGLVRAVKKALDLKSDRIDQQPLTRKALMPPFQLSPVTRPKQTVHHRPRSSPAPSGDEQDHPFHCRALPPVPGWL